MDKEWKFVGAPFYMMSRYSQQTNGSEYSRYEEVAYENSVRLAERFGLAWQLLVCILTPAGAGEVVDFGSRIPSVDELEEALKDEDIKGRGIRPINPVEEPKAVSMELSFDFDSAQLSPGFNADLKHFRWCVGS